MRKLDPVIYHELPVIQKIIADETWLEGERRGGFVSPEDPVVREHVCDVVLTIGEQLRQMVQGQCGVSAGAVSRNQRNEAA